MDLQLKNKVALITGAGKEKGIGFGIAAGLAKEGCNIVLADLPVQQNNNDLTTGCMEETKALAEKLAKEYGVKAMAVGLDVSNMDSCVAAAEEVKKVFPVIHVLCNNAGVSFGAGQPIHAYDEKLWQKSLDINTTGVYRVTKCFVPLMTEGGSIINTASRAGKVPPALNGAYAVSKAAVIMMSKVMAKELAPKIRVNAICPGQIMTDMEAWRFQREAAALGTSPEIQEQAQVRTIALARMGYPKDVADVVVWLASEASSYITGQTVNICGGQLMEL